MNLDKLKEEGKLNKFLGKVARCKERCRTSDGKKCLGSLEFDLVDKLLQHKFNDFS